MDLEAYMKAHALSVNEAMDAWLPATSAAPKSLHSAMRHLMFPGGKRLRPILAIAGAEAVGSDAGRAMPIALAVELIHVYSLIHDDLPCMDDDDERRGVATVHIAFDEATALLAGDALQASAFECLASADGVPGDALVKAVAELAHTAGSLQLVGGQADDLAIGERLPDEAEVEAIHLRKTAALLTTSVVGGARLGGAKGDDLERLREYGVRLGVAFQIADDLLDAESGEPCSTVRVLGVDGARARASALIDGALERLEAYGKAAEALRALARFSIGRDL